MKKRRKPLILLGFPAEFLAFPRGFEPPACRLGGDRSILLSYGNITYFILDRPFYISKTRVPNRVPNPDLMAAAVCISHKKPHSTGFFSMHPVALGGYSLPLGGERSILLSYGEIYNGYIICSEGIFVK